MGAELESLELFQGLLPSEGELVDESGITSGRLGIRQSFRQLIIDFCLQLVKTVDLDPKKNYVFGFHPHGNVHMHTAGKL